MSSLASASIAKELRRDRVSEKTPILSPTEDNFFYCENNKKQSYIGAMFTAGTLNGMDDHTFKLFVGALSVKLPANTSIQITHLCTSHVSEKLDAHFNQKINNIRNNPAFIDEEKAQLIAGVEARSSSYRDATRVSPIQSSNITLRDNRLLFTIKVPADLKLSEYDLERAKEQILSVYDSLRNSCFYDIYQLSKEEAIAQLRSIIYPFSPYDYVYDEYQLVSEQVFQKTTTVRNNNPEFLQIDDTFYGVLSVKALPKQNTIGLMNRVVGDPMGSHRQIGCSYLINCTIIIPDTQAENNAIEFNYMQTNDTATPFALKMSPKLRDRKDGLEVMFNETKRGEIPCRLYFNMVLFSKDKVQVSRVMSALQNYYKSDGLSLTQDSKIVYPLVWNALPMYPSTESLKNMHRSLTMTVRQACTFAPVFSDFQNFKEDFSQAYYTRRGNLYGFDPMRGQNHNGMIFGSSGGGKSVTTNNFIMQEYEAGALIRVIDEGQSYKKLCAALGGTFIEFTDESKVCLNPFTLVEDIHEDLDYLTAIVCQMASPTTVLTDFQVTAIKRAIGSAFNSGGPKTTVSDVADFLGRQEEPEVKRLGRQMYDYTDNGPHAHYFNGDNNLNLKARLVVLELEGLKANEQLKTVVMMLILARIQHDMYFDRTSVRKFAFFEEVTSYLKKPVVAEYISDFYARLRKYSAGCWLVTQNIQSIAMSESISNIMLNANYIIYLPYKSQEIDVLAEKGYVSKEPFVLESFKSLRLVSGQYSEAMIFETDTSNISVVRLILNDYERILYSSTGAYFKPFLDRLNQGEKLKDIITDLLDQEKKGKSNLGSVDDRDVTDALKRINQGDESIEQILIDLKRKTVNSNKTRAS